MNNRMLTFLARIALAGLLLLTTACASKKNSEVTIGVLNLTPSLDPVLDGFKEGMNESGYIEGENITYIYDGPTGSIEGLETAVDNLMTHDLDLLLALSTPAALEAKKATADNVIPVLFAPINDPVGAGLVDSLPQPDANMTGVKVGGFVPKELEWLLTIDPSIQLIFAPYNPDDAASALGQATLQEAAPSLGVDLISPAVRSPEEIEAALAAMPNSADAIFMLTDSMILSQIEIFSQTAVSRGIPLSSINAAQVEAGALMAYGPEFFPTGKQTARLAAQILKGTPPSNLPVETADFFLTINQATANAIGLPLSNDVLRAADTIIR